jgi:hypothetical protein
MQRTVSHAGHVDPAVAQEVENDAGYRYENEDPA